MEESDGIYVFDPSSGCICKLCEVGIRMDDAWSVERSIRYHESLLQHIKHGRCATTEAEQKLISTNFRAFIDNTVRQVRQCLPCVGRANDTFLSIIGEKDKYDYCGQCNILLSVKSKATHNSKLCTRHINTCAEGVKNSHCKGNIIPVDGFDITNKVCMEKYACRQYIEAWTSMQNTKAETSINDKTTNALKMLREQKIKFDMHTQTMKVQPIINKLTPNLYATILGWNEALDGCTFKFIYSMQHKDRFGNYEEGIGILLDRFSAALWYILKQCQQLPPTHPVLCQMGTKDGGLTKKALNLNLEKKTWKKYFQSTELLCLLVFRLKSYISKNNITNEQSAAQVLPTVHFTEQQLESMDKCFSWMTYSTNDIYNESQQKECHDMHIDFFLSLIDQQIGFKSYHCPLIAAVAIMSVDGTGFVSVRHVSSKIAGILTVFRMILVYDSIKHCIDNMKNTTNENTGTDLGSKEMEVRAIQNSVRYLHINDHSFRSNPLRELIKCVTELTNESKAHDAAEAKLSWSQDKETVTYLGRFSISMTEIIQSIRTSIDTSKALLHQILGYDNLPKIMWDQITDDPNNRHYGFSFMKHPPNEPWLNTDFYIEKLQSQKSAWWDDTGTTIDPQKTILFLKQIDTFRSKLLALIHTTGGQPARGSELTNITFQNSSATTRNIFIVHGCVHIRTQYTKTMMQTKKYKYISRYLPREVGELLVYYLWLVVPFWQQVKGAMSNGTDSEATKVSPFLFGNDIVLGESIVDVEDVFNTEQLTLYLRQLFGKEGMMVQSFRQIAIGIFKEKLGVNVEPDNSGESEDDVVDLQAAHSTAIAKKHYAKVVNQEYDSFYSVSRAWHGFIMNHQPKIQQILCVGNASSNIVSQNGSGSGNIGSNNGSDFSSTGNIGTNNSNIGTNNSNNGNTGSNIDISGRTNTTDKDFDDYIDNELGWVMEDPPVESVATFRPESATISEVTVIGDVAQQHYVQRLQYQYSISESQMLDALRTILQNDQATFRGNQLETIKSIIHHVYSCIVQICGTGIGKSVSFLIPALLSNGGVTVVVAPLVALEHNHLKEAQAGGITAVIWDRTTCDLASFPSLIFITPESMMTSTFSDFLARLLKDFLLDRIIFDECHLILESSSTYRPSLRSVITVIQRTGVQVIFLTATLSKSDESTILQLFRYGDDDIDESIVVYRTKTARTNISYIVDYYNMYGNALDKKVIHYLNQNQGVVTIIYVVSKKIGHKIRQLLKDTYGYTFGFYYSDTDEDKKLMLQHWMDDTTGPKIIIATTSLGCGVHVPNVGLVLHVGTPFSFVEYVQGSGRAGRDGEPCFAVLLHNESFTLNATQKTNGIAEYVQHGQCRRVVIDKYMDGESGGYSCCNYPVQCEPCDSCMLRLASPICHHNVEHLMPPMTLLPIFNQTAPFGIVNPKPVPVPVPVPQSIDNKYASKVRVVSTVNDNPKPVAQAIINNNRSTPLIMMTGNETPLAGTTANAVLVTNATHQLAAEQRNRQQFERLHHQVVAMENLLEELLNFFANKSPNQCLVCKVFGMKCCGKDIGKHIALRKQVEQQRKALNDLVSPNYTKRTPDHAIPPLVVCFKRGCFVPQRLCDRKGKCFYADILLDVVHILLSKYPAEAAVVYQKVGGREFMYRLLTRYSSYGNTHLLLHEIFIWLCNKYVTHH